MKEPTKTYVGLAVFFDRLADDELPEDAGWWPGERTPVQHDQYRPEHSFGHAL